MPRRAAKSKTTTTSTRPPPDRVYKSQPRLRQRRLAAPTSSSIIPPSAQLPPVSLYRQQTLTQLIDLSSNSDVGEEDDEQPPVIDDSTEEYSDDDVRESSPSKKRKRDSAEAEETRKRQSTLTQIDFFYAPANQISSDEIYGVVHEDDPGIVLPEYQEPDVPISPPGTRKSKQRGIALDTDNALPTPATVRASRYNTKRKPPSGSAPSPNKRGNLRLDQTPSPSKQSLPTIEDIRRSPLQQRSTNRRLQPAQLSPPQTAFRTRLPKTPKKPIKLEIPSSQTPPTTPLTLPRSTRRRDALSSPSRPPRSPLAPIPEHVLAARDALPPPGSPSARRSRRTGVMPTKFEIKETTEEDIENFMPASLLSNVYAPSTAPRHIKHSPSSKLTHTQHTTQLPTSLPLPWPLPSSNSPFSHPSPQIPSSPPLPTIDSLLRDRGSASADASTTHHSDALRSSQATTVDLGSSPPAPVIPPTSTLRSGRTRIIPSSQSQTHTQDREISSSPARATYHTPPQHNLQPPSTTSHRTHSPSPAPPSPLLRHDSNGFANDEDNNDDDTDASQLWFAFSGEPGETQARRLGALDTQGAQSLAESGDVVGATQLLGESLAW